MTTRPRRPSEVDGVHYHFIDPARFVAMRDRGELLEWAEVHGNLYGTPRLPVETALAVGRDVLFDIDWQGTRQIAEAMPERHRAHLRPAADDGRAAARGSNGGRRTAPMSSAAASPMPGTRSGTGENTSTSSSTTTCRSR